MKFSAKFAEVYTTHGRFMSRLVDLAVKYQESTYYHLANIWLSGFINPKKPEMYEAYLNWFKLGSTNDLKKLLIDWTDFDEKNLIHFNAFSFIDSAKIGFNSEIPKVKRY